MEGRPHTFHAQFRIGGFPRLVKLSLDPRGVAGCGKVAGRRTNMTHRCLGHALFFLLPALVASSITLREAAAPRGILIGAAVSSRHLQDANYAALIASEFNQLEPENEMKFGSIHPRPNTDPQPYNFGPADALVAFAQTHHLLVRGHTLLWQEQVPEWVSKGKFTPEQLAAVLHDHISTEVSHFGTAV